MQEIAEVLNTAGKSKKERLAAQQAFLERRSEIWKDIQDGTFLAAHTSSGNGKFVGAPRKTGIRRYFLLASKLALRSMYKKDQISDLAQRDLLFSVLRDREVFPNRSGQRFYCCPKCPAKLYECASSGVFRYIDNAKWKAEIESGRKVRSEA